MLWIGEENGYFQNKLLTILPKYIYYLLVKLTIQN